MIHFDGFVQDDLGHATMYFTVDNAGDEYHLYNEFPHSDLVVTYSHQEPRHVHDNRIGPHGKFTKPRLDKR